VQRLLGRWQRYFGALSICVVFFFRAALFATHARRKSAR
jgi:hypothetical protein